MLLLSRHVKILDVLRTHFCGVVLCITKYEAGERQQLKTTREADPNEIKHITLTISKIYGHLYCA